MAKDLPRPACERHAPSEMELRLELFVENMGETAGFYRRVLGFEVVREEPGEYASPRLGGVLLRIDPIFKLLRALIHEI